MFHPPQRPLNRASAVPQRRRPPATRARGSARPPPRLPHPPTARRPLRRPPLRRGGGLARPSPPSRSAPWRRPSRGTPTWARRTRPSSARSSASPTSRSVLLPSPSRHFLPKKFSLFYFYLTLICILAKGQQNIQQFTINSSSNLIKNK